MNRTENAGENTVGVIALIGQFACSMLVSVVVALLFEAKLSDCEVGLDGSVDA
jgi:hypothetical protein